MNDIHESIMRKLKEIEQKENVRILHCIESGSRAWGFPSPDSDYDVRFIYVRNTDDYLRLDGIRDVIEWQLDEVYDISGWDLQKMLRLLYKSNPTVFEWNNSPVIYSTTECWNEISRRINDFFVPKSGLFHYVSMAKADYKSHLTEENVRLKKYFYVLRPILACKWIIDKGTPPPMLFTVLADAELDKTLLPEVNRLLDIKMNSPEISVGKRVDALNEYIARELEKIAVAAEQAENSRSCGWEELNGIFLSAVND